jgi:hypothetical protein
VQQIEADFFLLKRDKEAVTRNFERKRLNRGYVFLLLRLLATLSEDPLNRAYEPTPVGLCVQGILVINKILKF